MSQKREVLKLLLEKEKILKDKKLSMYKPHSGAWRGAPNDGQLAFHKSDKKVRLITGGNQSGKTIAGAVEFVWRLSGTHPFQKCNVPVRGRIISSLGFEEGANQVIIPKLMEWMPDGLIKKVKNNSMGIPAHFELVNGSVFDILSGEQDKKVFEGWTGHICWIDEPPPRYAYEATRRGLMKNRGSLWMTMTPLSEPWIYNELWQPWSAGDRPDVECFTVDIYDNCVTNGGYLPLESIKEFEKDLDDDVKESRIHGKFRHLSGRVYNDFDIKVHVIPKFHVPYGWPVYSGIDPHLRKPHAYCQWVIHPTTGDIIVCDEIWNTLTIEELAKEIKVREKGKKIVWRLIDPSSETPDSISRKTPRSMLADMGIETRLAFKDRMIDHGIHIMKSLLKPSKLADGTLRPRFLVMDHCRRHIQEFMNYVYDDRDTEYLEKDKPRKVWDDMMDLDRYFIVLNPQESYGARTLTTSTYRY